MKTESSVKPALLCLRANSSFDDGQTHQHQSNQTNRGRLRYVGNIGCVGAARYESNLCAAINRILTDFCGVKSVNIEANKLSGIAAGG
jgi:hypothetical protein